MGGASVAVLHPQDCLTPVKPRRNPKSTPNSSTSTPNFTRSDGRKRSPPSNVRRHKSTTPVVSDPPSKTLVMGQVKILKRGDDLPAVFKDLNATMTSRSPEKDVSGESSEILKDFNDRKATNAAATTMTSRFSDKVVAGDRKVTGGGAGDRKVTPAKKKLGFANPKIEGVKIDDFALSSTRRLGPDPEMVPKQMSKNMADFFFAGSAFVDSPPPSSVPIPGFFTKSFNAVKEEDASNGLRRMLGLSPF